MTGEGLALRAVFRAGQTFLTWRELPALSTEDASIRYRLYRSTARFTAPADLTPERLLAEVGPHTGINLMASIDRMALSQTPVGSVYEPPRRLTFTVDETAGPLPPGTGLFVHTARAAEAAHYAITAVVDGIERSSIVPGETTLEAGIEERVEPPLPVRQNDEIDYVHWTGDTGTPHYPAMSSIPSVPYTFRVRLPSEASSAGGAPVIGLLHGALHQYNTPDSARGEKMDAPDRMDAVRVSLDSPLLRGRIGGLEAAASAVPPGGWYGYNDHFGTGKPLEEGTMEDYHVRRVVWTMAWVTRVHGGDPDRVILAGGSMGGAGVLVIGLLHPERFAAIHAHIPLLTRDGPRWRRRPDGSGQSGGQGARLMEALPFEPAAYIAAHASVDFPFIMCTAGRTDHIVGWPDKLALARAAAEAKAGFVLYWDVRGHGGSAEFPPTWGRHDAQGRATHRLTGFSRKQSFPALADVTTDDDPGTVDLAVHPSERPPLDSPGAGDLVGTLNGSVDWDRETIEDTSDRYAITLRLLPHSPTDRATATVTPRRLQEFRVTPGEMVRCRVSSLSSEQMLIDVTVQADELGRVSVTGVPMTSEGTRLHLAVT